MGLLSAAVRKTMDGLNLKGMGGSKYGFHILLSDNY